jgi:hypothetical protein
MSFKPSQLQILNIALDDEKEALKTVPYAPSTFPQIKKEIQVDDTPEQLTETSTPCVAVTIQANKNNSSTIYLGPSAVDSDSFALEAGNSITVCISDASLIYLYGKNGDKVVALYES